MQSDRRYCVRHKLFNIHNMAVGFMFIVLMIVCEINGAAIIKRDTTPGYNLESVENNGDKSNVNYDEYPMVVPKRTVALLDRLIRALSHTLDDVEQDIGQRHNQDEHTAIKRMRGPKEISTENEYNEVFDDLISGIERRANRRTMSQHRNDAIGFKRGGHGEALGNGKGRVYWRCYFNAVTCF